MNAHQKYCYRLLVKNNLTFLASTYVGQELPENYLEKLIKLIKLNEAYRKQSYLELSQIANMNETPIFLYMARTKTIAKISSKTVNIKTHGQDKVRVTAILWIVVDGTKLPPMLIFKGEPTANDEQSSHLLLEEEDEEDEEDEEENLCWKLK